MATLEDTFREQFIDKSDEKKVLDFIEKQFGFAKQFKREREIKVKWNIDHIQSIEDFYDIGGSKSGRLSARGKSSLFRSPILTTTIEEKSASKWFPHIKFDPEQRMGDNADVYLARNLTNIHNFLLDKGGFYKVARDSGMDLFAKGRCFFYKTFGTRIQKTKDGNITVPTHLKFRRKDWDNVFWTKDMNNIMFCDEYTIDELILEFGDSVKRLDIKEGSPFKTGDKIDFEDSRDRQKKVQVLQFWNAVQKVYYVLIGGEKTVFKKLTGDLYPWTRGPNKEGFIPVDYIDASPVKTKGDGEGHPISDIDKIVSIYLAHSTLINAGISSTIRASQPKEVIESNVPMEARNMWLQHEADKMEGYNVPYFMKTDGIGNAMRMNVLQSVSTANESTAMIQHFFNEAMMATGVNYLALGQGAPTAEQERLRNKRELEIIDKMIITNEDNWSRFAKTNIAALSGVDIDFLSEYVAIEDEVSDNEEYGTSKDGTVRDIIDNLADVEFNVRVSINNENAKRVEMDSILKEEALTTWANIRPDSPIVGKLASDLIQTRFPSIKFAEEDFESPQQNAQTEMLQQQAQQQPIPNEAQ